MRPELPVLIKARALIADPANWGKGASFMRRDTCCAAEAIEAVSGRNDDLRRAGYRALNKAADCNNIVDWNDAPERTHADVLAAFDRAIEAAA